jgi:hypothetical protein
MITLPRPPRRAHLRSFWIALCAMLSSSATTIMWFFALPHPLAIPLATGTGLVAVGLMMPEWIRPFYTLWNKVARRVASITRLALMGICYFVVFVVVAQAGARFTRKRPRSMRTTWTPRGKQAETAGPSFSSVMLKDPTERGWATAYFIWARRTRNCWAIVLLPFLSLLSVLADDDKETLPAHIYTLF